MIRQFVGSLHSKRFTAMRTFIVCRNLTYLVQRTPLSYTLVAATATTTRFRTQTMYDAETNLSKNNISLCNYFDIAYCPPGGIYYLQLG